METIKVSLFNGLPQVYVSSLVRRVGFWVFFVLVLRSLFLTSRRSWIQAGRADNTRMAFSRIFVQGPANSNIVEFKFQCPCVICRTRECQCRQWTPTDALYVVLHAALYLQLTRRSAPHT